MNVESYSVRIRKLVNDDNIHAWHTSKQKQEFCAQLVSKISHNELTCEILRDVLFNLIKKKADDRFARYVVGEEVTILNQGQHQLATVVSITGDEQVAVKRNDQNIDEVLIFTRSKEHFFMRMDGNQFSRICKAKTDERNNLRMTA